MTCPHCHKHITDDHLTDRRFLPDAVFNRVRARRSAARIRNHAGGKGPKVWATHNPAAKKGCRCATCREQRKGVTDAV